MNELIDKSVVLRLRDALHNADPSRAWNAVERSSDHVDGLQLRARSDLVAAAILADSSDYDALAATVSRALLSPELTGWMVWPVSEAVTSAALQVDAGGGRFDDGLALLAQLTPRLTGEFAIRRFLATDLDRALAEILPWTLDSNEHVRRLASEGTRPFLPWAVRVAALTASPAKTLPILDALRRDRSDYVRRSVANHLNDLSRQNASLVVEAAARWLDDPDENTRWVVRHGLRTLIKKADPGALALLGFAEATVRVSPIEVIDEKVTLPGALDFAFTVTNDGDTTARLAIDYIVSYVKSSGSLAEKVFKLTTRELAPGETAELGKRHAFHQMTTRVHYAGTHLIELQINGRRYSPRSFDVALEAD